MTARTTTACLALLCRRTLARHKRQGAVCIALCRLGVKAKVADGTEVTISEETDYPFGDTVALRISTPKP